VIWSESGVEGAHRFVQRVWRIIGEAADELKTVKAAPATEGPLLAVSKAAHKTLKAVQEDLDKLAFNKAIARIYELVNTIAGPFADIAAGGKSDADKAAARDAAEILIRMIAPMTPHLAEECWTVIGNDGLVAQTPWPAFIAKLVEENEVVMPVQINGKKRAELTIARDADQDAVKAAVLALDAVVTALAGNAPKKIIVVPQRIVNIVV
jgi:leucyl-tRNA synthetase